MYQKITADNPYETPMKIYPAVHYTMGGLWVDYNLMSNVSGLHVIGEANFSDHGANRLGASALMQGLADSYFVLPYTIGNLATEWSGPVTTEAPEFKKAEEETRARIDKLLSVKGTKSPYYFHRAWKNHGTIAGCPEQRRPSKGNEEIPKLREQFWKDVRVAGTGDELIKH